MVKYPTGTKVRPHKRKSRNLKAKPRKIKFNNRHVTIDGITFDSKIEAEYYRHLQALKIDFRYHQSFPLLPKFKIAGKAERGAVYTPDFTIYTDGKLTSVVDTKGNKATMTDASRLRMKFFMYQYHVPVVIATQDRKTKVFEEKIM